MTEHLYFFLNSFVFAALITWIAWRRGFFQLGPDTLSHAQRPSLLDVSGAFLLFLAVELLLIPGLAELYVFNKTGNFLKAGDFKLDKTMQGWFTFAAMMASAVAIVGYSFLLPVVKRKALYWGNSSVSALRDFFSGALTWFLSYPWVIALSHLLAIIFYYFGPLPEAEQEAVKQLKFSFSTPWLFWCTVLSVIFLVPLAEEILFRGFLQRGIIPYVGRWGGIALASLIFAFFHFSTTQGWTNIELILSLFILSCYLGFIYEKRGSIWAPVGLHMTFNLISILAIIWQEGAA